MTVSNDDSNRVDPLVLSFLERGEFLASTGRHDEATNAYRQAIASDSGQTARNAFACHLTRIEAYEAAARQFAHILQVGKTTGDRRLRALAYNNLAAMYRQSGKTDQAARLQQQSIADSLSADGSDAEISACDLANLANDALLAGNLDLAEQLFHRSLAREREAGSLEGEADDLGSLGVVAMRRGAHRKAVGFLADAYRLHRRLGDQRGTGCDLQNLAEVCWQRGHRVFAFRCLRRAIATFDDAGAGESSERARAILDEAIRVVEASQQDPLLN